MIIYTKHENFAHNDICINDLDDGLDGPVTITYLNYKIKGGYKEATSTDNADMFAASSQTDKMISMIKEGKTPGNPFG